MGETNLQILIEAVDNASATIQGVGSQLQALGGESETAAAEVSTSWSEIGSAATKAGAISAAAGTGILAGIYSLVKAAADSQVSTEIMNTSLADNVNIANEAAKGQGALGANIDYVTNQRNKAQEALNKLTTVTVASTAKNDAANLSLQTLHNTLTNENTQLGILESAHIKAGTSTASHDLAITKLKESIATTTEKISMASSKLTGDMTPSIKGTSDTIATAQDTVDKYNGLLQLLKGRLDDAGKSSVLLADNFQPAIEAGVKMGFNAEETRNSLTTLSDIMGTKMASATEPAVEGLVRASNGTLDLASATKLLGVAMETGMGKGLATYGIMVKDGLTPTELLGAVIEQTKGQVSGFADTLSGKLSIAWATLNDTQDKGGKELIDVVGKVVDGITKVIIVVGQWIDEHPKLTQIILIGVTTFGLMLTILGTLAVTIGGLVALFTGPVVIAFAAGIVAVAAMVAGFVALDTYIVQSGVT